MFTLFYPVFWYLIYHSARSKRFFIDFFPCRSWQWYPTHRNSVQNLLLLFSFLWKVSIKIKLLGDGFSALGMEGKNSLGHMLHYSYCFCDKSVPKSFHLPSLFLIQISELTQVSFLLRYVIENSFFFIQNGLCAEQILFAGTTIFLVQTVTFISLNSKHSSFSLCPDEV